MASGLEIVFPVRTVFEMESANKAIQDMYGALKGGGDKLKLDFGKITPGEGLTEKLGGYQQFFETVRRGAQDVGRLTTDYTLMKNAMTGDTVAVATKEMYTLKGATGETSTTFKDFSDKAKIKIEDLKKLGYVLEATTKEEANFAQVQKMGNDAIKAAEKAITGATTAAEKYLTKSKNMGGQQVQVAKQAAQAVLDQAKAISTLDKTSQKYADGFAVLTQKTKEFNVALEGTKVGANAFQGWSTRIANAIQQTIAYSFSIGLVYKAQQLLNDAVRYAIDLNTEMVKIQVLQAEGASTPEEIDSLAKSFNDLGKEMGASTLEIARGSVEWFRQGRTVAETQELMRSSMMLSKLGAMQSADATNYLTSITNAFKIEVQDTVTVVDKLIAVDNIAATSAGELATAMRYTSESAAIAGVEMEQLVSYIATVSTVTRQNAEMIGQAFKTMFARMTQIQGGGTDEEGWTISKVEKALAAVNIEIKNADGTWRNMGTVLEETAAKWDTLNTREQTEIATAVAGVRQKEAFLVLMDNMDKALTYQAAQTDATGLAMDRYGIYLESVEAKQGKLTASLQELYASVVNSKMVSTFYDIAIGIVQTITQGKLLIPILATILYLIIAINRETIKGKLGGWLTAIKADPIIKALKNLRFELIGLIKDLTMGGVSLTNFKIVGMSAASQISSWVAGLGAGSVALGVLAPALLTIIGLQQLHKKHLEDEKKALEESTKAAEDYIAALKEFPKKQEAPKEIFIDIKAFEAKKKSSEGLSTDEAEELKNLYNELYSLLPNLNFSFDEMGNAILNSSVTMGDLEKAAEVFYANAIGGEENLIFWINKRKVAYNIASEGIGTSIEKQEILNNLMGSSVEEIQKWVDEIKNGGKEWVQVGKSSGHFIETASQAERDIANALQEAIDNGIEDVDMLGVLAELSKTAASDLANDQSSIDAMSNEYEQLWMMVLNKSAPGLVRARLKLEELMAGNKELADARVQAEIAIAEQAQDALNAYYAKNFPMEAIKTDEELIKLHEDRAKAIEGLSKAYDTYSNAVDNAAKKAAIQAIINQVEALKAAGEDIPDELTKNISDFILENGEIDTRQVDKYTTSLYELFATSEALRNRFPDLWNSLQADSETAIANISTQIEYLGQKYTLSGNEMQQTNQWVAESLWNMGKTVQGNMEIVLNNGTTMTVYSSQEILNAMAKGYIGWAGLVDQATEYAIKRGIDLATALGEILNAFNKNLPFNMPPPISIPTGGGGGGAKKDPRVAAIEDEIKGYEDEIYHLEEIIEDLEEKIKPIQDAIDAEQRLIELHQREIDVIDEQIDHIDRQIELKERQIDAIDDLIEKEERKKDVLDRQIDSYQRQIDLIDRQIEMHERDKEVLEDAIKAQEKMKEPFEAQKEELEKLLDSFSEYIDAQKEALEIQKEEADYAKQLLDLNKKLSATQAELALASLDTSEEGMKRRLELEMQLAKDQEALTETTEERKFELQVRALEDAQKAYEKSIEAQQKALDAQIAAIDTIIAGYEKQIEDIDYLIKQHELEVRALEDLIYPLEQQKIAIDLIIQAYEDSKIPIQDQIKLLEDSKIPLEDAIYLIEEEIEKHEAVILVLEEEKYALEQLIKPYQDQIDKINEIIETLNHEKSHIEENAEAVGGGGPGSLPTAYNNLDETVRQVMEKIMKRLGDQMKELGITEEHMQQLVQKWIDAGNSADGAYEKAKRYIDFINRNSGEGIYRTTPTPIPTTPTPAPAPTPPPPPPHRRHEGGFASEHGPDVFEGTLKDSEIFAKLLKGEYVATEDQMRNFLRKTLPSIATEATRMLSDERDALKAGTGGSSSDEKQRMGTPPRPPSMSIQPVVINSPPRRPSDELIKPISQIPSPDYGRGDMNFEMNINVEGSLDERVLPRLKKDVIKEINKSLEKRGIRRNAVSFSI